MDIKDIRKKKELLDIAEDFIRDLNWKAESASEELNQYIQKAEEAGQTVDEYIEENGFTSYYERCKTRIEVITEFREAVIKVCLK